MSMLERISTQLLKIEQKLKDMLDSSDFSSYSPAALHNNSQISLQANIDTLHQSIRRLGILSELTNEVKGKYFLQEVVDVTLDAVWRRADLTFAVLILGEQELGPYHYHGVRGELAPWRHLLDECPFPLYGSLAQAILRRRTADESDYLLFEDLLHERPDSCEFPWLPERGSLLFVPLRFGHQTIGALMLGAKRCNDFQNDLLCRDLCDIGSISAEAIRTAQMHHEATTNAEKLVYAQLLSREIIGASDYSSLITILTDRISEVTNDAHCSLYLEPRLHHLGDSSYAPISFSNIESQIQLVTPDTTNGEDIPLAPAAMRLAEWAIEAGQPLLYEPDKLQEDSDHPFYNETGSAAIVPIVDGDRTYGALHLTAIEGRRKFDESDMVVLRTLTNCAAASFAKFQLAREKENSLLSALHPLVDIVESRFAALDGHIERTTHNAALLAKSVGLSDAEVMHIRVATTFHDIGLASLGDEELQFAHCTEHGAIPLTTVATLAASHEILSQAGICDAVRTHMVQLMDYWEELEMLGWVGLPKSERKMESGKRGKNMPLFVRSIDEETQELESIVQRRRHHNHRHYGQEKRTDIPDQPSSFSTLSDRSEPLSHSPRSEGNTPFANSPSHTEPRSKRKQDVGESSGKSRATGAGMAHTKATQIIVLAQLLDEFLIYSSKGRAEDLVMAKAFLQGGGCKLIDPELTQLFHSLVAQELTLLP